MSPQPEQGEPSSAPVANPILVDVVTEDDFDAPVVFSNYIVARYNAGESVITFMQVVPSWVVQDENDQPRIRARTTMHVVMTHDKVRELHSVLGNLIKRQDAHLAAVQTVDQEGAQNRQDVPDGGE